MKSMIPILKGYSHSVDAIIGYVHSDGQKIIVKLNEEFAMTSQEFGFTFGNVGCRIIRLTAEEKIIEAEITHYGTGTRRDIRLLQSSMLMLHTLKKAADHLDGALGAANRPDSDSGELYQEIATIVDDIEGGGK